MRSKKLVLAAIAAAMLSMTGCGSIAQQIKTDATKQEETKQEETKEKETKEETKETEEKEETKETEETKEKEDKNSDSAKLEEIFGTEADGKAFVDFDEETGYLGATSKEIANGLEAYGIIIDDLSQDNMDYYDDAEDQVLFHFAMYNEESVQEVESGDCNSFVTQLLLDNEEFYVLFGNDEAVEYEDAVVYCEEGTLVEYWALGSIQDGGYMVLPVVAGNEENGYYLVCSSLESIGVDMSDTMTLAEQGIDFTTDEDVALDDEDDSANTVVNAELSGEESIYLEITGKEGDEESLTVYYEMTSSYPVDVYLSDEVVELNGVDITDSTISLFEVEANDSIEDCFFIEGYDLNAGDELVISGMLVDNDTFEEIGEIEFSMVLESR